LLIGGAAKNPAVRKIATEIFGQDIFVPPAGEYVADGAARQAAWALSGNKELPNWSKGDFEKIAMDSSKSAVAEQVRKRYFEAIQSL
jgi:xylulokinase